MNEIAWLHIRPTVVILHLVNDFCKDMYHTVQVVDQQNKNNT